MLPTGIITFLLTDIEGSTNLWEQNPELMGQALARHDRMVADAVAGAGGLVVKSRGEGDSVFSVFARPSEAVVAAAGLQRALVAADWPPGIEIRVRMSIHTGEAELREGDYFGPAVNRCARLRGLAQGGQVLVSAAARQLVGSPPGELGFRDLGEHSLKGLAAKERVFQLTGRGLPEGFAPLAESGVPGNLPVALASFVGREQELAELVGALAGARLLVITGMGGSGKTRMAIELAQRSVAGFGGGAWLVELADLRDPELVLVTLARSLGLRESPEQPVFDSILGALGARPALVLLDNCEHLIEACANLVSRLLGACPPLKVLATSREAFNLAGERVWPLAPLDQREAVALFLDRAGGLGVSVAPDQLDAVASICRQLEGIPLAIELAAGRTRMLTPAQISARLGDRFGLLSSQGRGVNARQQTLRATIDWSYRLLAEPEARRLRELTVFAGGFSLDAAERICSGSDHLDHLGALVDRSLLVVEPERLRYRLLDTIGDFARQELATGEADTIEARHAQFFLDLALQEARADPAALRPEIDNLRAALRWCVAHDSSMGLRLATCLAVFWPHLGFVGEGRDWLVRLVDAAPADDPELAFAHHELGWLEIRRSGADQAASEARAVAHFGRSAQLAGAMGDSDLRARALNAVAYTALMRGDNAEVRRLVEASLGELRTLGRPVPLAQAIHYLAMSGTGIDPPALQLERLNEARTLFLAVGGEAEVGMVDASIAVEHLRRGDFSQAVVMLREALAIRRRRRDDALIGGFLIAVVSLAVSLGQPAAALKLLAVMEQSIRRLGMRYPPFVDVQLSQLRAAATGALESDPAAAVEGSGELDLDGALELSARLLDAAPGG